MDKKERLRQIIKELAGGQKVDFQKRRELNKEFYQICKEMNFSKVSVDRSIWRNSFIPGPIKNYKSIPDGGWEENKVWQKDAKKEGKDIGHTSGERVNVRDYFNTENVYGRQSKKKERVDISNYKTVKLDSSRKTYRSVA